MSDAHHSSGEDIVIHKVQPQQTGRLFVLTSPALDEGARIDDRYSGWFDNQSPPLEWTEILEAESFALVVEDPDAPTERPVLHWLVWDIPGVAKGLPGSMPLQPKLPDGAVQGRNQKGQHGYMGPRPPEGHGVHRYHFQLFALSKRLGLDAQTPLEELLNALKATTIASADMVGLYERADGV